MSHLLLQRYLNELQTLRRVSGTSRELVVREAFKTLLKDWGKSRDLIFIPEYEYQTLQKTRVYPDGALLHALRVPLGYWEAKDEEDDLDDEIEKKFRKGYPQDNIIFDDSHEAVLIQKDPTIREKFNTYRFADHKEKVIDLLKRVTRVSVETMVIVEAMRAKRR